MVFSVFSLFFHPSQRQHACAAALAPCASAARAGASFMIVCYCTHSPLGRHSLLACTRYPLPLTLEFWEIDHENFAGH